MHGFYRVPARFREVFRNRRTESRSDQLGPEADSENRLSFFQELTDTGLLLGEEGEFCFIMNTHRPSQHDQVAGMGYRGEFICLVEADDREWHMHAIQEVPDYSRGFGSGMLKDADIHVTQLSLLAEDENIGRDRSVLSRFRDGDQGR